MNIAGMLENQIGGGGLEQWFLVQAEAMANQDRVFWEEDKLGLVIL